MIIFVIIFLALTWVAFAFVSGWLTGAISKISDAIFGWFDKEFEKFQSAQRKKPLPEHADPFVQYEEQERLAAEILKEVRQAVAQAIATKKQLENQLEKSLKQAQTWRNRAEMAREQNNPDLIRQAEQRARQYQKASDSLAAQLASSAIVVANLSGQLATVELGFIERNTRHKQLLARQASADAKIQLNEFFAKLLAQYAEAQNKKAEEKLHGIIDRMPAALMVINKEGKILAVNPQMEKLSGHTGTGICESMDVSDLFEHGEGKDVLSRLSEISNKGICGANLKISDGRFLQVEVSVSHLDSGDLIICIFETGIKQTLF